MCGRFTLFAPGNVLARMFGIEEAPALAPRYNIAPSQPVVSARVAPEGAVESCALITTSANDAVSPIHERMPVILDPKDFDLWLDPPVNADEGLLSLLRPFPLAGMTTLPEFHRFSWICFSRFQPLFSLLSSIFF